MGRWLPQPAWSDSPPHAPAMLLAEVYAADADVTQHRISDKFDGVRPQWDGRALHFCGGGIIPAPEWFTGGFPAQPPDGELWIGRDQFDAPSGTLRKIEPVDAEWRQVRCLIFELPGAACDFSKRIRLQQTIARAGVPWLQAVRQVRVADRATLMKQLDAVMRRGRRRPDAASLTRPISPAAAMRC